MLSLTAAGAACGQSLVDPADPANAAWLRTFERDLAQTNTNQELECRVDTTEPALDYSLRYRAGFYATLPTTQFRPEETSFTVGLRVSALSGGVYYLAQVAHVPPAPRSKDIVMNFGGGFEPGEGTYKVDWLIRDERGRKCRKSWDFKLALDEDDRSLVSAPPPGVVRRLAGARRDSTDRRGRPYRVAVILNAAPISPNAPRLRERDQTRLLSTLNALFEQTPFQQASLAVVSLPKEREILRSEGEPAASQTELARMIGKLEFTTVGFNQLKRPHYQVSMLADLVDAAVRSQETPDAIVFIGPNGGENGKTPRQFLRAMPGRKPLFYYLQLTDYGVDSSFKDTMEKLTRSEGGRTFQIYRPQHLAKALRAIERDLAGSRRVEIAMAPPR